MKKPRNKKTRPFAVIDCETDPFEFGINIEPFIWGFYDGQDFDYYEADEMNEFLEMLSNFDGDVYAHNGGKFDYYWLWKNANLDQKPIIINGRLSRWKLGNAVMLDSYNILPVALSAIEKDKFDYTKMHKDFRCEHMQEIKEYLKNDCVYSYNAIKKFRDNYGAKLTLAGAAMQFWKDLGNEKPRIKVKNDEIFRKYYFGGRVCAFETGIFKGNFKIIDINSAYPWAMKNIFHPLTEQYYETQHPTDTEIERSFLKIKCHSKGALPRRFNHIQKSDGRILKQPGLDFPDFYGTYYVTGHELKAALETNTISRLEIKKAIVFENLISFSDYIDHFFDMKKKAKKAGDKAGYVIAKLFLNSLYGKFAMNPFDFEEYEIYDYYDAPPTDIKDEFEMGDLKLYSFSIDEEKAAMRLLNVATSASITGAVRAYLWESICKCTNVLYCDTDSIICEDTGDLELDPNRLGAWDIEGKSKEVIIAGKKLYSAKLGKKNGKQKYKTASKGVKLNHDQIKKVAEGSTILWQNPAPSISIKNGYKFIQRNVKKRVDIPVHN